MFSLIDLGLLPTPVLQNHGVLSLIDVLLVAGNRYVIQHEFAVFQCASAEAAALGDFALVQDQKPTDG